MIDNTPQVSIVMAVYNGLPWIKETIESVLGQTFRDYEFIIIDDNSKDGTSEFILNIADSRICYFKNHTNIGQTASLNKGVTKARGKYLARIDADDTWSKNKLDKQLQFMQENPEIDVLGTNTICINAEGKIIGKENYPISHEQVLIKLLNVPPVCHVSIILKVDAIKSIGLYPEHYKYAADYAAWSKMAQFGYKFSNLPERLTYYRQYPNSYGASNRFGQASDEAAKIIQDYVKCICNVELTFEECRFIDLIYKPESGLTNDQIISAYHNLKKCYRILLTREKLRTLGALWLGLIWTFAKKKGMGKKKNLNDDSKQISPFSSRAQIDVLSAFILGRGLSLFPITMLVKLKLLFRHFFRM